MQNCHGFSDDVINAQPLPNNFSKQQFVFYHLTLQRAGAFHVCKIIR